MSKGLSGVEFDDPCGSLPAQDNLWFWDPFSIFQCWKKVILQYFHPLLGKSS